MIATILTVLFAVWVLGLAVWIVSERRAPAATLGWIFGLAFLPYLGIPVYLFIGPRKWNRKKRHLLAARDLLAGALGEAIRKANRAVSAQLPPDDARLVRLGAGLLSSAAERARDLRLFHEGEDFYAALEQDLRRAEHHVHLEFYIWRQDEIGTRFRDLLVEKAKQGVEVRLLVDAVGSPGFGERFAKPLRDAGAEVVLFNEPRWIRIRPQLVNFRTHRKIVVIDGDTSYVGGMNIADVTSAEFVGARAQRDTHVRIEGAPTNWLQLVFLENWHFSNGTGPNHLDYLSLDSEPGKHLVQIAASGPDTEFAPIQKLILEAIHGAKSRVWATSPYFVPDEPLIHVLQTAALRGVDVRILVPAKSDHRLVRAASRTYYDELIEAGVKIYEYMPRMYHGKVLIADDDVAIVGTANLDNRSFRLNFEVMAVLYGEDSALELAGAYERDLLESRRVDAGEAAERSLPGRFVDSLARLFSPLL